MGENRSAKISPSSHAWIMDNKKENTVAEFVDILKNFYLEKNLPKIRPKNPGKVFFKCNKCKAIVEIPGIWEQSTSPDVDQISVVMSQIVLHNKYFEVNKKDDRCDGELYFYNVHIRPSKSIVVNLNDVYDIVTLDRNKIVITKIIDKNGIDNYNVGYLNNPYLKHYTFLRISLQDIYRNFEIIGRKNRQEPLKNTLNQIFDIDIKDIKDRKSIKEDLAPITKIFENNQIIPEGMFKEICLYIPAFRWTQNKSKTKYGTPTMHGDGMFIQNIYDIIDGKIKWPEAFNRYKS